MRKEARKVNEDQNIQPDKRVSYLYWIILFAVIAATILLRVRLLDVPLERDEGEYAYIGQLLLQGIPPFEKAYTMKLPGVPLAYALIMVLFGQNPAGIHTGLILVNAATILLLFLLCKKLFGQFTAIVSAASYSLLSMSRSIQGFAANTEHFVLLAAIAGIILLIKAIENPQIWLLLISGILFGLAFLMKQHAVMFIIFAGLYLLFYEFRRKPLILKTIIIRSLLFGLATIIPFAITCLIMLQLGLFNKFWFWTFTYASKYVGNIPLSDGIIAFTKITGIMNSSLLIWILAAIGFAGLLIKKENRRYCLFVLPFLFFSFLAVCPGLYFRPHYFTFLMPAIAIFSGLGATAICQLLKSFKLNIVSMIAPAALVLIALCYTTYSQREYLFTWPPDMVARMAYGSSPFPESIPIARYIADNSSPDDTIAVLGSEPQIPFYARRLSATSYIYTYPLTEPQPFAEDMQQEMIKQIEAEKPKFMVIVDITGSWTLYPQSEDSIFEWARNYTQKHYEKVGVCDILSWTQTISRWGSEAADYSPRSDFRVLIYQLK